MDILEFLLAGQIRENPFNCITLLLICGIAATYPRKKYEEKNFSIFNIAGVNNRDSYKSLSDKELADGYRQSANQEILATLFERYSDLIFGVCMKYVKNGDAAADACNDIYMELVEKMLKHEVQQVKAWLHTLTRNHCLIKLRGEKKMPTDEFPEYFMQSEEIWHPDKVQEKETKLTALENCLDTLKDQQKQAVSLFYMEQKSYNEIADITGIPWNNIRSQIQNGRRNLKICMEQHGQSAA